MVEVKLKWSIKKTKKGDKEYDLRYISIPFSYAMFLLQYEPYLDPINKLIIFKPKQNNTQQKQNNTQQNSTENLLIVKLRWRIKKTKKGDKEYPVSYINIPRKTALFLLEYEPVLDLVNKVIVFKPKQTSTQQNNTQNQPQSQ